MVDMRFPNQDLRNKDYKDVAAGDETHRYGDYIPLQAAAEEELEVGDVFELNADGEAKAYEGETDAPAAGVVYANENDDTGPGTVEDNAVVEGGELFTAKVQGTVIARDPGTLSDSVGKRVEGHLVLEASEDGEFVHLLLD